jgi:methyl-accepting chemotaxis protein
MDLHLAIAIHHEWKTILLAAIINKQQLDTATIAQDYSCELGKWLHSDGQTQFGLLPGFAACVTQHARFHTEAAKVATVINTQKYPDAHAMMDTGTAYSNASSALQIALLDLQAEAVS